MAQVFSGFAPTVQEKAILVAHHIIMCYLQKKRSTTLWFTWYAIYIYHSRDVAHGRVKVVK
jgi:alpha-galactosidase